MEMKTWVLDDAKATLLIQQGATVAEVAERLEVSRNTVYKAIRKGRIPAPLTARLGSTSLARPDSRTPATPRVETTG